MPFPHQFVPYMAIDDQIYTFIHGKHCTVVAGNNCSLNSLRHVQEAIILFHFCYTYYVAMLTRHTNANHLRKQINNMMHMQTDR